MSPVIFLLLPACDPTRLALDPLPLSAGRAPVGGGGVDARLAGCTWTERLETADGAAWTWEQRYDLLGRPVWGEGREDGRVYGGFTTTYDLFGCPVQYTTTGPDDMGAVSTSTWRQTCGLCGYVDAVYAEDELVERYRNTCDVAGKLVGIDIADADDQPWAHIRVDWQAARVVSWVQTDSDSGQEVWRQDYAFNTDGWIRTYAEDGERVATWTYDASGRAVTWAGSETLSYGYASDTAVFPERVTAEGRTGTIRVECD